MHETRRRIVELLRMKGSQTVQSLCAALQLSRTAVKSHLTALRAEGLVRRQGLRHGTRRPSDAYELTADADLLFPKTYDDFASALITQIRRQSPEQLREYLEGIADEWIARDLPRVEGLRGRDRGERVKQTLDERGFMPELVQTPDGYQLREHNCPLMRLTADFPEVCDMVRRWLEALFGTPMNRVHCLRLGDPFSVYHIASNAWTVSSPTTHDTSATQ